MHDLHRSKSEMVKYRRSSNPGFSDGNVNYLPLGYSELLYSIVNIVTLFAWLLWGNQKWTTLRESIVLQVRLANNL